MYYIFNNDYYIILLKSKCHVSIHETQRDTQLKNFISIYE